MEKFRERDEIFFKFFDLRIKQQINLWFFIEIPRNLSNRLQLRSMILTNKSYKNLFFKKKMRRKFNDKKKTNKAAAALVWQPNQTLYICPCFKHKIFNSIFYFSFLYTLYNGVFFFSLGHSLCAEVFHIFKSTAKQHYEATVWFSSFSTFVRQCTAPCS